MISLGRSKHSAAGGYENEKQKPLPMGHLLTLICIGLVALALRYWFNFLDSQHLNAYGACDASEYLRNAQAILSLPSHLYGSFCSDSYKVLLNEADPQTIERVQLALSSLKDLQIAGPTFSIFLAFCYAISFSPFSITNWQVPVFAQCIISALTCVFIAMTGCRAFNKQAGYISGLLAAFYPAFIVNSGRLYSETFAAFLLSVVLYITARNFTSEKGQSEATTLPTNLINGVFAASLQLTRSIMVVLSVALLPVIFCQQGIKKGIFGLLGFAIGFIIIASPWLVFQKLAFGTSSIVVDRVGHYNFFIGNNVDTAGWLSFPYPDGRGIEEKSLLKLAKESYAKSPARWVRLLQDKPLRLFKFPWNDFRTSIGGISFAQQVFYHQLMMLLAAIGLMLSYHVKLRKNGPDMGYERSTPAVAESRANAAKTFILFVFLIHCTYMLFITVPRYNLTAMPEVMLFAAGGVSSIIALLRVRRGAIAALTLVASSCLLFAFLQMPIVTVAATLFGGHNAMVGLVLQCILRALAVACFGAALWLAVGVFTERELGDEGRRVSNAKASRLAVIVLSIILMPIVVFPVGADGRAFEWQASIQAPGDTIVQRIAIPKDYAPLKRGSQPYLLIDANGTEGLAQTQIEINGKIIDAPRLPGIAMCDDFCRYQDVSEHGYMREGEWIFDCLSQSAGLHNADLRQWFIIPIAGDQLTPGSILEVKLRQTTAGTGATLYGSYPTSRRGVSIPSIGLYSWEKAFYGVENARGLSDTRYDTKTASLAVEAKSTDLSSAPGLQSGRFNIHILAGAPVSFNDRIYTVTKKPQPDPHCTMAKSNEFPPLLLRDVKPALAIDIDGLPGYSESTLWAVRVSGRARRNTGSAILNIAMKAQTADKKKSGAISYILPWGTDTHTGRNWRRFDLAAPLAPGSLRAPITKFSLDLAVGQIKASDASVPIDGVTEIKDLKVEIMRLPASPLLGDYQVL